MNTKSHSSLKPTLTQDHYFSILPSTNQAVLLGPSRLTCTCLSRILLKCICGNRLPRLNAHNETPPESTGAGMRAFRTKNCGLSSLPKDGPLSPGERPSLPAVRRLGPKSSEISLNMRRIAASDPLFLLWTLAGRIRGNLDRPKADHHLYLVEAADPSDQP